MALLTWHGTKKFRRFSKQWAEELGLPQRPSDGSDDEEENNQEQKASELSQRKQAYLFKNDSDRNTKTSISAISLRDKENQRNVSSVKPPLCNRFPLKPTNGESTTECSQQAKASTLDVEKPASSASGNSTVLPPAIHSVCLPVASSQTVTPHSIARTNSQDSAVKPTVHHSLPINTLPPAGHAINHVTPMLHHTNPSQSQTNCHCHHSNATTGCRTQSQSVQESVVDESANAHRVNTNPGEVMQGSNSGHTWFRFRKDSLERVVIKSPAGEKTFLKLSLLGRGGSSKVFKVIGDDTEIYALKEVYMKNLDPIVKQAYLKEINLLKCLKNKPQIVTLHNYDYDKQECILYILLEYAGTDLSAVIKKGCIPVQVPYFWGQMLQAVKAIHDENIIHNDLKPENFVCIGQHLCLIDFGIANKIELEHTSIERDMRCGTINYMAPETIDMQDDKNCYKVGKPSDVWSLGCILYQMTYGKTPFEHIRNKLKKCLAIVNSDIAFPDLPYRDDGVIDVMKKCLIRDPKKRPTVEELLSHPYYSSCH